MKIHSQAVHAGDRKAPGSHIPITTPIYTAASYYYGDIETVDRVFAGEEAGYVYARHGNPTNEALEELVLSLEGGASCVATASGMSALHIALTSALLERPKRILAAGALYGATIRMLQTALEPFGVETVYADFCDTAAVAAKAKLFQPGALLMETVSNPLLRVGEMDRIAEIAKEAGAALVVDNTFATPLLVRPLELGAAFSVHSATKYLSGHGDVMGGFVICDAAHAEYVKSARRSVGALMGPFEAYLSMRGIKTFPLRMERQCANASRVAEWLRSRPNVERVYFTGFSDHPDAAVIARLMPAGQTGAMVAFEIRDADRERVFEFMNRLRMIVPATSLGDVHSMVLYPPMSSHRDLAPKQRERMGIRDSLVRLSVGIEDAADIIEDLRQALAQT